MVMMLRTGHLEGRMLERHVLAGDRFDGMSGVCLCARVPVIGERASIGECAARNGTVCKGGTVRTRRGASAAHASAASAAKMAATATAAMTSAA